MMALKGIWGLPRSGLVFQKASGDELALHEVMPWSPEMAQAQQWGFDVPPTAKDLRKFQQLDFETISERFEAAGISVTDPKGLLKD
jgi:hypothetical protein